jgi:hypothetical protein
MTTSETRKVWAAFFFFSFLLLPTHAFQQTPLLFWVNATDPTCQGQSPCFTKIQAAIDATQGGATIRVQAGTYVEQLTLKRKNKVATSETDRLILEADPSAAVGSVVLQGSKKQCTQGQAILIQQSNFITIRGLTITGAGGAAIHLLGGNN